MKKRLLLTVICTVLCAAAFSAPKKNYKLELYADKEKTIDLSQMNSKFEYVTLFYQDIFFNLNLLNSLNKDDLREICLKVYENLQNGYRCQIRVKKFLNGEDLKITFGQMPDANDSLLITTNFDRAKNKIITNMEDMKDSWGLLYYLIDGKFIYYKNTNKPRLTPEEKLEKNLTKLSEDPKPIVYMMVVENYFEMNEIEKGIAYFNENKDKAISLSPKTDKPGNIHDVITCMEEESKIFQVMK